MKMKRKMSYGVCEAFAGDFTREGNGRFGGRRKKEEGFRIFFGFLIDSVENDYSPLLFQSSSVVSFFLLRNASFKGKKKIKTSPS